jgi:2-polyprenyl-3-methyl-5-hydroxy-6-metoxy-1,4-benzoquinol methylase
MIEILNKYGNVTGIDASTDAIAFCKKKGLHNVRFEDLNNWDSETEQFDVIISLDVLYHQNISDDVKILSKFKKALKKNGICILNLPAFNILMRPHDIVVKTKKRYEKKELINDLEQIGFSIDIASYRLPHLFIIILLSKLISKIIKKNRIKS